MNCLLEAIAEFCHNHLLDEKILIAPSLAVGRQLVESLPRNGHPWVNLRVETLHTLAMELVGEELADSGKKLLSRVQSLTLIKQACSMVLNSDSYFGQLKDCPGFHKALEKTLGDLRKSAIPLTSLSGPLFESDRKAKEIRAIAETYGSLLDQGSFVDGINVLMLALDKVRQQMLPGEAWYLAPDGLDSQGMEREFLEALAGSRLQIMPTDKPECWSENIGQINISRAIGEENEVRGVFRQILQEGISYDSVEIIYTDSETYIPLIYELSAQYSLPCTFAQGIPISFTHPGQAALGFLEWLNSGCDAGVLHRIIAEGCIDFQAVTTEGEPPGALTASRIIRKAAIGWGRDRYLPRLDILLNDYTKRLTKSENKVEDDVLPVDFEHIAREKNDATVIREFVARLLELSAQTEDPDEVNISRLAEGLTTFIEMFAAVTNDIDGFAVKALSCILEDFISLPSYSATLEQAVERLNEAIISIHINASTPKPGHIHVSEYRNGGYSGRMRTFVIGLDSSRHPGMNIQDPVLLDSERRNVNKILSDIALPLMSECPAENAAAMRACLARLRGRVTLSFSCRSLLEDREQFPASILLEVFRKTANDPHADYSKMLKELPAPIGFISEPDCCLDETEWLISEVAGSGRNPDTAAAIQRIYPWLEEGRIAEEQRENFMFTEYDGFLNLDAPELDPCSGNIRLSASRIEALAKCPFAYFVRYVLGIEPVEDSSLDPSKWLNALQYGVLMHEVFREFMQTITMRGEKPSVLAHTKELYAIADNYIRKYRSEIPPPNEAAFKSQRDDILRACNIFLKTEEKHCKEAEPCFFEVTFGYPDWRASGGLENNLSVWIELDDGRKLLLGGRIDRVDRIGDGLYQIWDYKTGGARSIREESVFNGGRQVQHALYAEAMNQLLQHSGIPGKVVASGYFFPALKGEGMRIIYPPDPDGLKDILSDLLELMTSGIFIPLSNENHCKFCDFGIACGKDAPERSNRKLECSDNTVFSPVKRLVSNER